jgi:hypothetical protein
MHGGELIAFDYEDFEAFDWAIGELLIRKVLHKLGFNQRDLMLETFSSYGSQGDMISEGMEAARRVFALLGYTLEEIDEEKIAHVLDDYTRYFHLDLELPELSGWSAQKLNPYRERWKNFFAETRYNKPDYEVRLRTIRFRRNVLRFTFDADSAMLFFFQLPTLIENFLHWREEMVEVIKGDFKKRQIA